MLSRKTVVASSLFAMLLINQHALAMLPHTQNFQTLAKQCAPSVNETTLSKIVSHESSSNPYAIGLNSKTERLPRQPQTRAEAIATAEWLYARGYSFDSGYGQINSHNLKPLGLTFEDLFTPCKNLQASAQILTDCYSRAIAKGNPAGQVALRAALSCYNTGNFTAGFKNGYVALVAAAPPATLAVPALDSTPGSNSEPIKLQAAPSAAVRVVPKTPAISEGQPDAFSGTALDAFKGPAVQQKTDGPSPGGDVD